MVVDCDISYVVPAGMTEGEAEITRRLIQLMVKVENIAASQQRMIIHIERIEDILEQQPFERVVGE